MFDFEQMHIDTARHKAARALGAAEEYEGYASYHELRGEVGRAVDLRHTAARQRERAAEFEKDALRMEAYKASQGR